MADAKSPKHTLPITGTWMLLGCFFRIGGKWELERDYFYAPYYELWEIDRTVLTVHTYGISLSHAYELEGDRLTTSPYIRFGRDTPCRDVYLALRSGKRLYLALMQEDGHTLNRVFVLERTGWIVGLAKEEQSLDVRKSFAGKHKIHWLEKDEYAALDRLKIPGASEISG